MNDTRSIRIRTEDWEKIEMLRFLHIRATGKNIKTVDLVHSLLETEYNSKIAYNKDVVAVVDGFNRFFGKAVVKQV